MDDREPKKIQNALRKFFPELIVLRLDYGDVVDTEKNIAIERKAILDLSSSIDDGRLINQAEGMSEKYDKAWIIKVGTYEVVRRNRYHKFMSVNRFIGGETDVLCDYDIPVLQVENDRQFARKVDSIFRKYKREKPRKRVKKRKKKTADDKLRVLLGIDRLGEKRARALLKQFTFSQLCKATEKDLMTIPGIGRKHASKIKKIFN